MTDFFPLQLLLATFGGWVNHRQAEAIDYLAEENRVLKEQLRGKRLCLTDDQRRRLAAKGKRLGRRLLSKVATIVTPDTIMRWHHQLIAAKWTYATERIGRPGIMKAIRKLIGIWPTPAMVICWRSRNRDLCRGDEEGGQDDAGQDESRSHGITSVWGFKKRKSMVAEQLAYSPSS